jgi:hypothetical protein
MSLRLFTLVILLALMAMMADATPPPTHGGYQSGWGMNPTNWQSQSGSFSAMGFYDPNYTGGGGSWAVGWNPTTYINYAPITLELWIEMYMLLTYEYTSYQWHRLGDAAETITFTIDGTMSSNHYQYVLLLAEAGWDPNYLSFQGNIGVGNDNNVRDQIPITWRGRWGDGLVVGENIVEDWHFLIWFCDVLILAQIPACDHWFQFEGSFDLLYHEADGYYKLLLSGCPTPAF